MKPESHVDVRGGVVVIEHKGEVDFDDAQRALAIAMTVAERERTRKLLFDLRSADLENYYSYIVRHAELGPEIGLDASFAIAFVGARDASDVLSFMERVVRNRGWNARGFFSTGDALKWLAGGGAPQADDFPGSDFP